MLVILAAVIGVLYGARNAQKRGGNKMDIAQYAASYGIAFGILGLLATVIIGWMGWA